MSDERKTEKAILRGVLFNTVIRCDSWGEVEDRGAAKKNGRYGVTVMFDTQDDARNFMVAIRSVTVSA